jgi:hypothetical protein
VDAFCNGDGPRGDGRIFGSVMPDCLPPLVSGLPFVFLLLPRAQMLLIAFGGSRCYKMFRIRLPGNCPGTDDMPQPIVVSTTKHDVRIGDRREYVSADITQDNTHIILHIEQHHASALGGGGGVSWQEPCNAGKDTALLDSLSFQIQF